MENIVQQDILRYQNGTPSPSLRMAPDLQAKGESWTTGEASGGSHKYGKARGGRSGQSEVSGQSRRWCNGDLTIEAGMLSDIRTWAGKQRNVFNEAGLHRNFTSRTEWEANDVLLRVLGWSELDTSTLVGGVRGPLFIIWLCTSGLNTTWEADLSASNMSLGLETTLRPLVWALLEGHCPRLATDTPVIPPTPHHQKLMLRVVSSWLRQVQHTLLGFTCEVSE